MPSFTNKGNGVLVVAPMTKPEVAFPVITCPVPFGNIVRFAFVPAVVISGDCPPAKVSSPADEIDVDPAPVKKLIFPFVPLVVDTNVRVPPFVVPPVIVVAPPPNVRPVVKFRLKFALVVNVVKLESLNVVVFPKVIVLLVNDIRFAAASSSILSPTTWRFPPSFANPAPVVIAAPFVVFKFNAVGLSIRIFPVLADPKVKLCLPVVKIFPLASSERALGVVTAEILAVGVPPATFLNENFALLVAVDPRSRSSVILNGDTAPEFSCQKLSVPPAGCHCGVPPTTSRICPFEPTVNLFNVLPLPTSKSPAAYVPNPVPPFAAPKVPVTLPAV